MLDTVLGAGNKKMYKAAASLLGRWIIIEEVNAKAKVQMKCHENTEDKEVNVWFSLERQGRI